MTEDWADELIFAGIDAETLRRIERKAKAQGMREAAEMIDCGCNHAIGYCVKLSDCPRKKMQKLADAADKVEKGL